LGLVLPCLTGCGNADREDRRERIACAIAGNHELKPDCPVERSRDANGILLTLRHPDGGFRRLRIVTDGRGVATADGADPATIEMSGGKEIDVLVSGDRYRLPATIASQLRKP
jgi:hypothetical protein